MKKYGSYLGLIVVIVVSALLIRMEYGTKEDKYPYMPDTISVVTTQGDTVLYKKIYE